jgi:hypothetical protein
MTTFPSTPFSAKSLEITKSSALAKTGRRMAIIEMEYLNMRLCINTIRQTNVRHGHERRKCSVFPKEDIPKRRAYDWVSARIDISNQLIITG